MQFEVHPCLQYHLLGSVLEGLRVKGVYVFVPIGMVAAER
jgi:hypothetical protein